MALPRDDLSLSGKKRKKKTIVTRLKSFLSGPPLLRKILDPPLLLVFALRTDRLFVKTLLIEGWFNIRVFETLALS